MTVEVFTAPDGPNVMVVSGAEASTSQEKSAVDDLLPAASTTRTEKACSPSERSGYDPPDSHLVKLSPSREHSKCSAVPLAGSATNSNVAEALVEGSLGCAVIVGADGAIVSTVNDRESALGSTP